MTTSLCRRPTGARRSLADRLATSLLLVGALALLATVLRVPAPGLGRLPVVHAEDWSQFRGPRADGRTAAAPLDAASSLELRVAWRRPLGSGYSSISTWGGRGYTLASLGEAGDYAVAFDLATGEERFRHRLGDRFPGRDGSSDGPLSTPALDDGRLFALSPRGELVALDATTGERLWVRSLPGELNARVPYYGFSTSPLVAGGLVIVETGGPAGQAVSAFDPRTGEVVWQAGEGEVEAHIPVAVRRAGRLQVLAATASHVYALDPQSGAVLWSTPQEGEYPWAQLTPAGDDGLLVTHDRGCVYYRFVPDGSGLEKVWSSRAFRAGGLNPRLPAYRDGYFYAHSGRFLSCVDASNGEEVWRSRPPGGQSLIELGGHLALVGHDGTLVTVAMDPRGYRETGRLAVLQDYQVYTPPSAADGRLYVRDLVELAAVEVGVSDAEAALAATPDHDVRPPQGRFARFLADVGAPGADARRVVDAYLDEVLSFPVVEDGWAHFLFVGDVADVAIASDLAGRWPQLALDRVPGTDVHHLSLPLGDLTRFEYRFHVFEEPRLDPLNPLKAETPWGAFSVWRDARWSEPPFLGRSAAATAGSGRVVTTQFEREGGRSPLRLNVYTPPAALLAPGERLPLLWVPLGREAIEHGGWIRALDHLYAGRAVPPAIVAFVELPGGAWWEVSEGFVRDALIARMLPWIEERFPVSSDRSRRGIVAQGDAARTSLVLAATEPALAGHVALQSPVMDRDFRPRHLPRVDAEAASLDLRIDYGSRDGRDPVLDVDVARDAAALAERLRAAGASVVLEERAGGFGWSRWRTELPSILRAFFGP